MKRKTEKPKRCPFYSRAWGCRCDLPAGHQGWCNSEGDGFAPGYDPKHGQCTTPALEVKQ